MPTDDAAHAEIRRILRQPPVSCGCTMPCNHWTPNHEDVVVNALARALSERDENWKLARDGEERWMAKWAALRAEVTKAHATIARLSADGPVVESVEGHDAKYWWDEVQRLRTK